MGHTLPDILLSVIVKVNIMSGELAGVEIGTPLANKRN
nr:MAG TPA: hypothetical protein [Caudoviricetes sp.]